MLRFIFKNTVKSDNGIYKCISKSPNGPYVTTKTELEVLDVSYIPEVDDWQVRRPYRISFIFECFIILCKM